ncbi:glycoside hydrolase family 3 protein [Thalassomonas sp. M1454]|uniref:glycoside hydrolase family 3 protein n=1 Tax=Thalassomonas sp. M1454 TaxID=2594477 RepID=UPI0021B14757|nr:glycoside hydrolase family 3 N-terminal domain-containing protein [Thalassomonas sp. M1454]
MSTKKQQLIIDNKVDDLLNCMSVEQKIGQMIQVERSLCSPDDVKKYHIGSVLSGAGSSPEDNLLNDWVEMAEQYWQASIIADQEHLPIPIMYGVDAVHGHNNIKGATIFPHNIGLGAANDAELVKQIAQVTTKEVLASGIDWVFSPNLAIAQDYHWGRVYESFAQSPELVTKYSESIIEGMQQNPLNANITACVKHWIADGGTSYGIDQGDTIASWSELEQTHLPPFKAAIESGALTIMASFSSWNGDKCHGHKYLITDVLKNQLKFSGFVLSDMSAIDYLSNDFYKSIGLAVNAGLDMFMLPKNFHEFIDHLHNHIELGTVPIERINDAVRRILTTKYKVGLFDAVAPKQRVTTNCASFGSVEHRELAKQAVRKSLVLLKNDGDLLPLNKELNILVTGKSANNIGHQCGGFTIDWQGVRDNEFIGGGSSIWQGIKQEVENCQLITEPNDLIKQAKDFDVAIAVIGEYPYAEGMGDLRADNNIVVESGSLINGEMNIIKPYGKTLELSKLHPEDLQTINSLKAAGLPVVTVLVSGRPMVVNKELDASNAFISAWLPGSEGAGVSDLLFGEYDFQGKLAFPWPNQKIKSTNKNNYSTLFPCGYGLTYNKLKG